uniref:von Willebrand factor D and EGF domains n=1 Tax=Oryzias latipes TaxID=8090 RepID=A0A3P9I899_ORYLA
MTPGALLKLLLLLVSPLQTARAQTEGLPPRPSVPVIVSEASGHTVLLRCRFQVSSDRSLGFVVTWSRLSPEGRKEELKQETTLHTSAVIELDGFNLRLGDEIFCSISSFFLESADVRGESVESHFFAGIRLKPALTVLSEDAGLHELLVGATVPVPCPEGSFSSTHSCTLPLQISTKSQDEDALGPDLSLSSCVLVLSQAPCTDGLCGSGRTHFSAITDFVKDDNRTTQISIKPIISRSLLWNGYLPEPIQVVVRDVPSAHCYAFTDPHMITFDGRYYENYQIGTFVLYKSSFWPLEVHVRQWECGSLEHAASCVCGVVVRDGGEAVALDMCNGVMGETQPQLTVRSRDPNRNGIRIAESYQGRKVTMTLASGAFVRADVSDWGMSLTLRAPGSDLNHTEGLCGTFDGQPDNDFHSAGGATLGDLQAFISEWRLPPGSSLFDLLPSHLDSSEGHSQCTCQKTACSRHAIVRLSGVIPALDVTAKHAASLERRNETLQLHPGRLAQSVQSGSYMFRASRKGVPASSRRRHRGRTRRSVPNSPRQLQPHSSSYFFPEDHEPAAQAKTPLPWPTPSGLTRQRAEAQCRRAVAESEPASSCRGLLGEQTLRRAVAMCVSDLQLKDDKSWLRATIPLLENECERRLEEEEAGGWEEHQQAVDVLRCPDLCGGNGQCSETGCVCFPGFGMFDCSALSDQIPEILELENEGLCDVRQRNCSAVQVRGQAFEDSSQLKCEFVQEKFKDGGWLQGAPRFVPASFVNATALECQLPLEAGPGAAGLDLEPGRGPLARWQIRVSNDGHSFTNAKILTLFDGACQVCSLAADVLCSLREKTCSIDGVCFREGESRPGSSCLTCRPDLSRHSWSRAEKNRPPLFRPPPFQLRSIQGEAFSVQLQAQDPEGSALLYSLVSGPEGASLSPSGLLTWKAAAAVPTDAHLFHFAVADECDAETRASVEVSVLTCDCLNGARCVPDASIPAGFRCACQEGFTGRRCEADADDCKPNPCRLGRCVDGPNTFSCFCPPGMTGRTCREDVDECASRPCFPDVVCRNSPGSFSCGACPRGYSGDGKTCRRNRESTGVPQVSRRPKRPDPASSPAPCSRAPCYPGVQCFQSAFVSAGFVCGSCPPGFHGNGLTCTRTGQESVRREPQSHIHKSIISKERKPVSSSSSTSPQPVPDRGSGPEPTQRVSFTKYETVAPIQSRPSGRGKMTPDLSAAARRSPTRPVICSGSACFPGVSCETSSSFGCGRCPSGYTGDGVTCRAVCRHPCGPNMECSQPNVCTCRDGYTGYRCHIAVCRPDCRNQGKCVKPNVCECPAGYSGPTCEEARCDPPCQHAGACQARNLCSCPYGYVGPRCEIMVCNRHCENGGECISPDVCQCIAGWFGPTCHSALCDPICLNGGTCIKPGVCACPRGFYGSQCQIAVCSPPCKNGGQCMRNNVCSCPEGYAGQRCQRSVCEPTCMNAGKCVGANTCSCASGWRGRRCSIPVCLQKCRNGGECVGPNTCHCPVGWGGLQCQTAICKQRCLNGGRCVLPDHCHCRRGFQGLTCAAKASSA